MLLFSYGEKFAGGFAPGFQQRCVATLLGDYINLNESINLLADLVTSTPSGTVTIV